MLAAVERFLKQAIVDRDPSVVNAALLTAYHFWPDNKEVVRRWLAETQQALNGAGNKSITQYHSLGLLQLMKQGDRMGLSKLIQQTSRTAGNSLAVCLMLRMYSQLLASDPSVGAQPMDLKPFLRQGGSKGEMVGLEAARIICDRAADVYSNDVVYAVTALQMFLGSAKSVVRFAALRIINDLASRCPNQVSSANPDIESLVTHQNRNVATLAITALLKTGDESSVDRLIKQISGYVGDISDEFRVIVVDAVRALCLKFPSKYETLLEFLGSGVLREEGSRALKQTTVDAICALMESIPGSREPALFHLCEFIEDSEYATLTVQILHVLGSLGPKTNSPSKLIRYIYNRLVLEDALVRVAAVGALTKFALALPSLAPGISSILRRCVTDLDDDVRDRAVISLNGIKKASSFLEDSRVPDLEALEQSLLQYNSSGSFQKSFNIHDVPFLDEAEVFGEAKRIRLEQIVPSAVASPKEESNFAELDDASSTDLSQFIEAFGPIFKSSNLVALTESGTEYSVYVRKHVFNDKKHVVLEFSCGNTVPNLLLSDIAISIQGNDLNILEVIPIPSLHFEQTNSCLVVCRLESNDSILIESTLNFRIQECDPVSFTPLESGFVDKYPLEPFEVGLCDMIRPRPVYDWQGDWDSLQNEVVQTFVLGSLGSISEATTALLDLYGVPASGGTAAVDPSSPIHTLLLSGNLIGSGDFAIRARMALARGSPGVSLELSVRSQDATAAGRIVEALG